MSQHPTSGSPLISDLPADELASYARRLGLDVDPHATRSELLAMVRARQELLLGLDRRALLDVVVWARVPVRESASKEELAEAIALVQRAKFKGLSDAGLDALARLRGVEKVPSEPRVKLEKRLRRRTGLLTRLGQKRRVMVGRFITKLLEGEEAEGPYRFLPEEAGRPSLQQAIEKEGVRQGLARQIRGVADQYVAEKLDEIERRIDEKLDQIDQRLGEWRDREIHNRLRIVKITLVATIVVAAISLGYDYLRSRAVPTGAGEAAVVSDMP